MVRDTKTGLTGKEAGILLEGGAMRSIFSAGVLDFWLEQGIRIPNVLAVSAGAYAGLNYVSEQIGRAVESNILYLEKEKYIGLGTFLRTGALFDMDLLFDRMPRQIIPFDFKRFFASECRFMTSTVNCRTGETVYYDSFRDEEQLLTVCRAANSLPLISKIVEVDGEPMLDGGMADAIPISRVLEEGWKKIVVVLTRDASYRKKKGGAYVRAIRRVYAKYPAFLKTVENRWKRYNDAIETIEKLEAAGRAFVLRPDGMSVANHESNVQKLLDYYEHGREKAREQLTGLKEFLNLTF